MTGGSVHVLGRVGHDAGVAMHGGELLVDGDAGDRLGGAEPGARRGMTGGEILVSGSVGNEAGMRTRRGLIAVGGRAGADLARDIIAGTVVVFGRIGERPGSGSKRGSIIALGGIEVPSTYRLACTYEPPFVRLLMTYLSRRFGATVRNAILSGRYRRFCGDAGPPGKGEILEWIRG
jgi:formylmethanofuran dehydrogenase subunit C